MPVEDHAEAPVDEDEWYAPIEVSGAAPSSSSRPTGWTERRPPGRSSPLVAVGGGAVLVAGLGAAVLLRPRRRSAED